jgi:hypothetical protein
MVWKKGLSKPLMTAAIFAAPPELADPPLPADVEPDDPHADRASAAAVTDTAAATAARRGVCVRARTGCLLVDGVPPDGGVVDRVNSYL